jgi:hypothetical protein
LTPPLDAGPLVTVLSALDTSSGVVLAQVTVDTKSNEIRAFTPLLNAVERVLGSLTGVIPSAFGACLFSRVGSMDSAQQRLAVGAIGVPAVVLEAV